MKDTHYEIERRFLIRYPDLCWLDTAAEKSAIVQTYLLSEEKGITERVRKRGGKEAFVYTHTTKKRISAARRIEIEEEIDEAQYRRLLQRADPARRTIEKTRYCLRETICSLRSTFSRFGMTVRFSKLSWTMRISRFIFPR